MPIQALLRFLGLAGLLPEPVRGREQAVAILEFDVLARGVVAVGRETACEDDLDLQVQDPVTRD
jgi:hypothetical protein